MSASPARSPPLIAQAASKHLNESPSSSVAPLVAPTTPDALMKVDDKNTKTEGSSSSEHAFTYTYETRQPYFVDPIGKSEQECAMLLGVAYRKNAKLTEQLNDAERRAERLERLIEGMRTSGALVQEKDANGMEVDTPRNKWPETALKAIIEAEARAEKAEKAQDEVERRNSQIRTAFETLHEHLLYLERRSSDAREAFARFASPEAANIVERSEDWNKHPVLNRLPFSALRLKFERDSYLVNKGPEFPTPSTHPHSSLGRGWGTPEITVEAPPGMKKTQKITINGRDSSKKSDASTVPTVGSSSNAHRTPSIRGATHGTHTGQTSFQALPLPPPPSATTNTSMNNSDIVVAPSIPSKRQRSSRQEWTPRAGSITPPPSGTYADYNKRPKIDATGNSQPMHPHQSLQSSTQSAHHASSQRISPTYASHSPNNLPNSSSSLYGRASPVDQRSSYTHHAGGGAYTRGSAGAPSAVGEYERSGSVNGRRTDGSHYNASSGARHHYSNGSSVGDRGIEREGRPMGRGLIDSHGRDRSGRPRSLSRSSAGSSWSIDEMLLEAAADQRERAPDSGNAYSGHPSYVSRDGREYGGARDGREYGRAGEGSRAEVGPHREPPSLQSYQTHIFAPPVTGAPAKKNKTVPANQLVTLGPGGVIVSGGGSATAAPAAQLPGGGFPATNAMGQRICRQCGMAGRYKDGKCVEKWGPGPEGPGTVCDRCRKKMKRVERRGTIDQAAALAPNATNSQSQLTNHGTPLSVHSNRPSPPQRQDTLVVEDSQRSDMLSPQPSRHNIHVRQEGTHSPDPRTLYNERHAAAQQQRHVNHQQSMATSQSAQLQQSQQHHRRPPTPPYITSISTREQQYANGGGGHGSRAGSESGEEDLLDGENENDAEAELDVDAEIASTLPNNRGHGVTSSMSSLSSNGSASPKAPTNGAKGHINGSAIPSNINGNGRGHHYTNGSSNVVDKSSINSLRRDINALPPTSTGNKDVMDIDGEADADAEADPDAELLDAVDAADDRLKVEN